MVGQNFPKAKIALCKCGSNNMTYGVRMEEFKNGWKATWAFPIKEKTAKNEGYDAVTLKGQLYSDENYPGCPYCGSKDFFICYDCGGKLTCYHDGGDGRATCAWCHVTMDTMEYDGSGIMSGDDR